MIDVGPAIRSAIIADTNISSRISTWQGSPSVFTRTPVPEDATFPCIVVPFAAAITNQDALVEQRAVITRDVMIYGNIAAPGTPEDHTRIVDDIAYDLRNLFHRNRESLGNTPYHVIDIVASGPIPAPVDDDATVGRRVTLTLRIQYGS